MKFKIYLILALLVSCQHKREASMDVFIKYYEASKVDQEAVWEYSADTLRVWFESKKNEASLRYRGKQQSKWGEWDDVMHATSHYDSIWFDSGENAVRGYFFENNDFYKLIGASSNKTLRTYFLNEDLKISGLLYERIPTQNSISEKHMKPIVEWALVNDSVEITELYPDNEFVPSAENALRWKTLLARYSNK